jgi:hypothetical protein
VWLKVQPESDSAIGLTWGNSDGPYPVTYSIGRTTLLEVAKKIRGTLDCLAEWAKLRNEEQLRKLLSNLAVEGARLRFVIFDCPTKASDVARIEQWVAEQFAGGDKVLTITSDPTLHVPWGLTFDGDPDTVAHCSGSIADYEQFWSLKFTLSMAFSAYEPPAKSRRSLEGTRLLSVVNPNVFAEVKSELPPDQFQNLCDILNKPVGTAYNLERCNELIDEAVRKDTLFHFFGHGKDGVLDLCTEAIDVIRFKMMMARLLDRRNDRSSPSYNLIFLNACDTAAGQLDASFRTAASQPGLCGFVATEAPVPRKFAAYYGYRFLKSMLVDGESIGCTMDNLRRDPDLWPLSLLYSCYALANYKLTLASTLGGTSTQ